MTEPQDLHLHDHHHNLVLQLQLPLHTNSGHTIHMERLEPGAFIAGLEPGAFIAGLEPGAFKAGFKAQLCFAQGLPMFTLPYSLIVKV